MANYIYLETNLKNLSTKDITDLNNIYDKQFYLRPQSTQKVCLCLICSMGILSSGVMYLKLIIRRHTKSFDTFTAFLAAMSTLFFVAYISFFSFKKNNNIHRTPDYPGHTGCPTKMRTQLEVARTAVLHMFQTATRWLILILATVQYENIVKRTCFGFRLPLSTKQMLILVLCMTTLIHIPHCVPNYLTYSSTANNLTCYGWQPLVIASVFDVIFEDVSIIVLTFAFQMMIIISTKEIRTKIQRNQTVIGYRAVRPTSIDPTLSLLKRELSNNKSMSLVLILTFVTSFPTAVRRIMILSDTYDPQNYIFDELICDAFDLLILLNSSIVPIIYYGMFRKIHRHSLTPAETAYKSQSMALTTLIEIENKHHNFATEGKRVFTQIRNSLMDTATTPSRINCVTDSRTDGMDKTKKITDDIIFPDITGYRRMSIIKRGGNKTPDTSGGSKTPDKSGGTKTPNKSEGNNTPDKSEGLKSPNKSDPR